MKNKLYYILIGLIFSFSFVKNVFAVETLDFSMSASANNNTVVMGEKVTITLNLKSDIAIGQCEFVAETDSNIVYSNYNSLNNWSVAVGDKISIDNIDNLTPYTNGKGVIQLVYQVNGSGRVTFKNITCTSVEKIGQDDKGATEIKGTYSDVTVELTAQNPADDTTLKKLSVTSGGTLASEFKPNVYDNYIIFLSSVSFGLSLEASYSEYQDDIVVTSGSTTLDPSNISFIGDDNGMMHIKITVNGKSTYNLLAVYEEKVYDNSLSSVKINGALVPLQKGETNYRFEVDSTVNKFSVVATLTDSENFQISSESNIGTDGQHEFTISDVTYVSIVVEPKNNQSGAKKESYNIEVVKKGASKPSSSAPSSSSKPSSNKPASSKPANGGNVSENAGTGDISMFLMAFILIASLVGSIVLYQKNLESYK